MPQGRWHHLDAALRALAEFYEAQCEEHPDTIGLMGAHAADGVSNVLKIFTPDANRDSVVCHPQEFRDLLAALEEVCDRWGEIQSGAYVEETLTRADVAALRSALVEADNARCQREDKG